MAQAVVKGGVVTAVYDDRWALLLSALGRLSVDRATKVEWNDESQEWVAYRLTTGEEIARGINRAEVIAEEVRVLNAELEEQR